MVDEVVTKGSTLKDAENNETGFLDVAANTLAVILIVALFAIQQIQQQSPFRVDPYAEEPPPLSFPLTVPRVFPPYSRYYLLFDDGIVSWDQEKAVRELVQQNFRTPVRADGTVVFSPMPFEGRDVDSYRVTWTPAFDELQKRLLLINDDTIPKLTEQLEASYKEANISPTFLVLASGMDAFAKLYPQLVDPKRNFRWRWYSWKKDRPIVISRSYKNFVTLGNAW
ncbi:MAG: hypothetical protein KDI54_10650 [Gammaproteobacteria bacterium]|nr:hypothetical protein [Gammaproteobacteria bacterium]